MAAPDQHFVRASGGSDGNGGTSHADAWATILFAVANMSRNATDGDTLNINGSHTLTEPMDVTNDYGAPAVEAPLTFRGYTSTAGDGGIGTLDGDGSFAIIAETLLDSIIFADLHLTNTGSAVVATVDVKCRFINCEIDTSTGGGVFVDDDAHIVNCYFHDITGAYAINGFGAIRSVFVGNIITCGVTLAGIGAASSCFIGHNIVKLTTTNNADGIKYGDHAMVYGNSIFATAGTGNGIVGLAAGVDGGSIFNNIVEGFSGTGGAGYSGSSSDHIYLWGHNAAINNTINDERSGTSTETMVDIGGDDIPLSASAFTDPSSNDFSVGTEVKEAAMPNFTGGNTTPGTTQFLDMGAAQREEPAGGGGTTIVINRPRRTM